MKRSTTKKWIATLLVAILTILGLGQTMVHATEVAGPRTDVVITKVETDDAAKDMSLEDLAGGVNVEDFFTDGKVLQGVSFTWFSVTDAQLAAMKANPANFDTAGKVESVVGTGSGTVTNPTNASGQVTIPNLAEGNYWIVENSKDIIASARAVPFGLTLPFTNLEGDGYLETIYVYPKNTLTDDEPDIEKTVDESNVAIGQLNTWTVTLDIPLGIEDYDQFSFYDNIDSRLDFEGLDRVIAEEDGINLVKGTDYTVAYAAPRLDVVFTEAGRIKLKGADPKKVDITFKTRVNYTAIMGQEIPNSATLEFDNNHGKSDEKTPEDIPSVHTGGRAFLKKDGKSKVALKDAEFKIKNNIAGHVAYGKFVTVGDSGVITFDDNGTIFKSDGNGKFEVSGLPYGSYVLVETKAPEGYALPTDPNTPFEVDATSYYANPKEVTTWEKPADVIKVINNRKLVIPQTGGMGTVLFTVIGAAVMLFSVVFYRRTKEV